MVADNAVAVVVACGGVLDSVHCDEFCVSLRTQVRVQLADEILHGCDGRENLVTAVGGVLSAIGIEPP